MLRNSLMSSSSSFAHLLGLGAAKPAKKAVEEDDPDEKEHREDAKAEDDKDMDEKADDDKDKGKRKAKAKSKAKSDETEEDGKNKEDDEDDDKKAEDDDGKKAVRLAERARCETIFLSPHAGARPDLAAHFAFRTDLSAKDAIASLAVAGTAPAARRGLAERMTEQANPELGSSPEATDVKPHQRLLAAHAKATGKK